jgi:hypothetical protein
MLSISPPMSGSGKGDYHLKLSHEDYYLEGGEPPGQWSGRGAEQLGLEGQLDQDQFRNVLSGKSPDGKNDLVQNAGAEDRQSGWDLTFSAPKSVSVAWPQSEGETRKQIQEAHREAVEKALQYLDENAGFTRRGKGGSERARSHRPDHCDLRTWDQPGARSTTSYPSFGAKCQHLRGRNDWPGPTERAAEYEV